MKGGLIDRSPIFSVGKFFKDIYAISPGAGCEQPQIKRIPGRDSERQPFSPSLVRVYSPNVSSIIRVREVWRGAVVLVSNHGEEYNRALCRWVKNWRRVFQGVTVRRVRSAFSRCVIGWRKTSGRFHGLLTGGNRRVWSVRPDRFHLACSVAGSYGFQTIAFNVSRLALDPQQDKRDRLSTFCFLSSACWIIFTR